MCRELVIIIIPVYKDKMNNYEEVSFRQCLKILNKYPITIICPKSLNTRQYTDISKEYNVLLKINLFDDLYFYKYGRSI